MTPPQAKNPKKLLLRMPNWIGDLVMATPLIHDIKAAFPSCHLSLSVPKALAPLLEADPHVDRLLPAPNLRGLLPSKEAFHYLNAIRKQEFDTLILTPNSFSSALQGYFMKIPCRIGFQNEKRSFLLSHALSFPKDREKQHLVKTYKALLAPLKISPSITAPKLFLSKETLNKAEIFFSSQEISSQHLIIGINPGAAYGSAKCWPKERFAQVAKALSHYPNTKVLFFGSKDQQSLVDDICQGQNHNVWNLAGKTKLDELCALIQRCDLMLSNDSGPMHLAYALQVPVVAIFGSTSEVKTGPYQGGKVIHKHVSCSPCFLRTCPIDFPCMKQIFPQEVLDTMKDFLKLTRGKTFH